MRFFAAILIAHALLAIFYDLTGGLMTQYNIAEAKAHLSELLQKAMLGEEVIIAKGNQPVARLVPVEPTNATRVPGSAKAKIIAMAPDFDDPPPDFQDYT